MSSSPDSSAVWRTISATLLSALVTGISAWLVFGQGSVDREAVSRMIASESPYIADKRAISERLESNGRLLEKVAADVAMIRIEQARLMEKVEVLSKRGQQ